MVYRCSPPLATLYMVGPGGAHDSLCAIATIGERMFAMRPGLIERLQGAWASNPVQPI